jgi:quercetin dioxygenase-like cupin family protein
MTADPSLVAVKEEFCNACGTPRVNVHHQSFPELWTDGESPEQAAERLATRLEINLDSVSDPSHRERVRHAIADIRAYLTREAPAQPKLSEVITICAAGPPEPDARPMALAKTETLEIRRLTLPKGREIPTHHAPGEIVVQCLAGRIAFTSGGATRDIGAGQMIVLAAGEPHSLVGLEDSSVLVTKVLRAGPAAPEGAPSI